MSEIFPSAAIIFALLAGAGIVPYFIQRVFIGVNIYLIFLSFCSFFLIQTTQPRKVDRDFFFTKLEERDKYIAEERLKYQQLEKMLLEKRQKKIKPSKE